jgi:hypothetical protein
MGFVASGNLLTIISAMGSSSAYNFLTISNAAGLAAKWSGDGRLYMDHGGVQVNAGVWCSVPWCSVPWCGEVWRCVACLGVAKCGAV